MIQAIESIRRSVVVPVAPDRAFEVFTSGMTGWWPSDHHIGSAPIEQIVIEPREGGRWYTRHTDGSETSTGYVAAWEPPERVVVTPHARLVIVEHVMSAAVEQLQFSRDRLWQEFRISMPPT